MPEENRVACVIYSKVKKIIKNQELKEYCSHESFLRNLREIKFQTTALTRGLPRD